MKKFLACVIALFLCLSAALAQDRMVTEAASLAEKMTVLAGNADYRAGLGISGGEICTVIDACIQGNYASPRMILQAGGSDFTAMISSMLPTDDAMVRAEMNKKIPSAMLMQLVAYKGTAALAAVSSVTIGTVFSHEPEGSQGIFLLLYDHAAPIAVTWLAEKGAVQMSALFLPDEKLAECADAEAVNVWFAGKGFPVAFATTE